MEVQLQELIDQIKKQGVDAGENEAAALICAAQEKAEAIVSDAQEKAERILLEAKQENDKMTKASEDAIRQAGRNLLISFRESVSRELRAVIGETVSAAYQSPDAESLIVNAVECFAKNPEAEDITLVLNEKDLNALSESLLSKLKEKISAGITLKSNDTFDHGFRIAVNQDGVYYDYSAEAVVDMLANYLSPRVTHLLKEAE